MLKEIEPKRYKFKSKHAKRRSRRRIYTISAAVAVLLAIGLFDYVPPLFWSVVGQASSEREK